MRAMVHYSLRNRTPVLARVCYPFRTWLPVRAMVHYSLCKRTPVRAMSRDSPRR